jgi:hypothetical protein
MEDADDDLILGQLGPSGEGQGIERVLGGSVGAERGESASANALPMPSDAPVTMTTLSLMFMVG